MGFHYQWKCWPLSCVQLCNAEDCSPPGSSVHGILQARILEGVASHALLQGSFFTQVSCVAGRIFTIWVTRGPWDSTQQRLKMEEKLWNCSEQKLEEFWESLICLKQIFNRWLDFDLNIVGEGSERNKEHVIGNWKRNPYYIVAEILWHCVLQLHGKQNFQVAKLDIWYEGDFQEKC